MRAAGFPPRAARSPLPLSSLLEKKQEHLEHQIQEDLKFAKANASKNKKGLRGGGGVGGEEATHVQQLRWLR